MFFGNWTGYFRKGAVLGYELHITLLYIEEMKKMEFLIGYRNKVVPTVSSRVIKQIELLNCN